MFASGDMLLPLFVPVELLRAQLAQVLPPPADLFRMGLRIFLAQSRQVAVTHRLVEGEVLLKEG